MNAFTRMMSASQDLLVGEIEEIEGRVPSREELDANLCMIRTYRNDIVADVTAWTWHGVFILECHRGIACDEWRFQEPDNEWWESITITHDP